MNILKSLKMILNYYCDGSSYKVNKFEKLSMSCYE